MRHFKFLFIFLLVIIISFGLFISIPSTIKAQADYILGSEDVLEIIVWSHDDLTREIPISLEGYISFPLIGEIKAAGKSTNQLAKNITKKLAEGYIIHPQVTVTVKEYKSQKFFIMGEVQKPGKFDLEPGITVLMAISLGGGLTEKAAPRRTLIRREEKGKKKEFKITMDTLVQSNDTIIVPERFF